ncbi:MAG: glycosyltransferase family 2 protein [Bacilli bacterium]
MIILKICDILFISVIIIDIILFVITTIRSRNNHNYSIKESVSNPKFAILIPARDESKVIGALLKSIEDQTFDINMKDVYVIVEDINDYTCDIVKKYGATTIVRKNLELRRKGYALDEAVKFILDSGEKYDAYFIFDADNVLDKDYFRNMNETFFNGYDIGIGYRNTKNGNDNVVATCSTLTFSMINTLGNLQKNKDSRNVTISGTGFYIKGSFIEKWKGYPFHTLTEDYELTLYSSLNEMTSFYNDRAMFYDEQPTSFKVSLEQRTRWIRGFFDARKIYVKKLYEAFKTNDRNSGSQFSNWIGVKPYILIAIFLVLELFAKLVAGMYYFSINRALAYKFFGQFLFFIIICYIILLIATMIIIIREKKIDLSMSSKIKAIFFNPIFLISYVYCAIMALTHKDLEWKKINHG